MCEKILQQLQLHIECTFPRRVVKITSQTKKLTPELITMKDHLKLYQRRHSSFGNEETATNLTSLRHRYVKCTERQRREEYVQQIRNSDNKSKTVRNVVNAETDRKGRQGLVKKMPSCDEFNNHFTTQANDLVADNRKGQGSAITAIPTVQTNLSELVDTSEDEILSIIQQLPNKTSTDAFEISTRLIKQIANEIVPSMTELCNKCLRNGIFPDILKIAKVQGGQNSSLIIKISKRYRVG